MTALHGSLVVRVCAKAQDRTFLAVEMVWCAVFGWECVKVHVCASPAIVGLVLLRRPCLLILRRELLRSRPSVAVASWSESIVNDNSLFALLFDLAGVLMSFP